MQFDRVNNLLHWKKNFLQVDILLFSLQVCYLKTQENESDIYCFIFFSIYTQIYHYCASEGLFLIINNLSLRLNKCYYTKNIN